MTIRLGSEEKGYIIDLGELAHRYRSDFRYPLVTAVCLLIVFLLCWCLWGTIIHRPAVPTASIRFPNLPGSTVSTAATKSYNGPGPHRIPARTTSIEIAVPGFYSTTIALSLTANTTTTLTPTLYSRPTFQAISSELPNSRVAAAYPLSTGAFFQAVITTTQAGTTKTTLSTQWWQISYDGRKERLLALEQGPFAWNEAANTMAMLRPTGLYIASPGRDPTVPTITTTADITGLTWWQDTLVLLRTTAIDIRLDLLGPTASTSQYLLSLALLPDTRYTLSSPKGDYLLIAIPGQATTSLLLISKAGTTQYLADLPATAFPWAYVAWESPNSLAWTAPQQDPSGTTTWPIHRIDLPSNTVQTQPTGLPQAHGLWIENSTIFILDGQARVYDEHGQGHYTITEIQTKYPFDLWKIGSHALLQNAGRYWLLSWPTEVTP